MDSVGSKPRKQSGFHVVFEAVPCGWFLCCVVTVPLVPQAPSSLLDALEQHLASLEGKKVKDSTAASRWVLITLSLSSP